MQCWFWSGVVQVVCCATQCSVVQEVIHSNLTKHCLADWQLHCLLTSTWTKPLPLDVVWYWWNEDKLYWSRSCGPLCLSADSPCKLPLHEVPKPWWPETKIFVIALLLMLFLIRSSPCWTSWSASHWAVSWRWVLRQHSSFHGLMWVWQLNCAVACFGLGHLIPNLEQTPYTKCPSYSNKNDSNSNHSKDTCRQTMWLICSWPGTLQLLQYCLVQSCVGTN